MTSGRKGIEVEEDGEEGEEGGEGVLAFGDPGDGFDAERMEGPDGGGEEGNPGAAYGKAEDEEEEYGGSGVEEDVGEVVAPRVEGNGAEEEVVEEKGNPEEGAVHAPVAVEGGEGARESGKREPFENDVVVDDEYGVVESDEEIADGGREEGEGKEEEEDGGKEWMAEE